MVNNGLFAGTTVTTVRKEGERLIKQNLANLMAAK